MKRERCREVEAVLKQKLKCMKTCRVSTRAASVYLIWLLGGSGLIRGTAACRELSVLNIHQTHTTASHFRSSNPEPSLATRRTGACWFTPGKAQTSCMSLVWIPRLFLIQKWKRTRFPHAQPDEFKIQHRFWTRPHRCSRRVWDVSQGGTVCV